MGIRRALAGAVLGLAGSVLLALPAFAAAPGDPSPYPVPSSQTGSLGTTTTNVGVGGVVVISGNGFAPGTTITINITVNNGFRAIERNSAPAMGSLLATGKTRSAATVQGFAAQTVNADANGAFTASVTLTQAGVNVITASGLDPDGNLRTLTTTVLVGGTGSGVGSGNGSGNGSGTGSGTGSGSGGGSASGVGGLPNTGADLKMPVILGGALVLLGGGTLVASRRRKQRVATTA